MGLERGVNACSVGAPARTRVAACRLCYCVRVPLCRPCALWLRAWPAFVPLRPLTRNCPCVHASGLCAAAVLLPSNAPPAPPHLAPTPNMVYAALRAARLAVLRLPRVLAPALHTRACTYTHTPGSRPPPLCCVVAGAANANAYRCCPCRWWRAHTRTRRGRRIRCMHIDVPVAVAVFCCPGCLPLTDAALFTPGIFRVTANMTQVRDMIRRCDAGDKV